MHNALRQLPIISRVLIASVLLCLFIGERIAHEARIADAVFYQILVLLAIAMIVAIVVGRRMMVMRVITALMRTPMIVMRSAAGKADL